LMPKINSILRSAVIRQAEKKFTISFQPGPLVLSKGELYDRLKESEIALKQFNALKKSLAIKSLSCKVKKIIIPPLESFLEFVQGDTEFSIATLLNVETRYLEDIKTSKHQLDAENVNILSYTEKLTQYVADKDQNNIEASNERIKRATTTVEALKKKIDESNKELALLKSWRAKCFKGATVTMLYPVSLPPIPQIEIEIASEDKLIKDLVYFFRSFKVYKINFISLNDKFKDGKIDPLTEDEKIKIKDSPALQAVEYLTKIGLVKFGNKKSKSFIPAKFVITPTVKYTDMGFMCETCGEFFDDPDNHFCPEEFRDIPSKVISVKSKEKQVNELEISTAQLVKDIEVVLKQTTVPTEKVEKFFIKTNKWSTHTSLEDFYFNLEKIGKSLKGLGCEHCHGSKTSELFLSHLEQNHFPVFTQIIKFQSVKDWAQVSEIKTFRHKCGLYFGDYPHLCSQKNFFTKIGSFSKFLDIPRDYYDPIDCPFGVMYQDSGNSFFLKYKTQTDDYLAVMKSLDYHQDFTANKKTSSQKSQDTTKKGGSILGSEPEIDSLDETFDMLLDLLIEENDRDRRLKLVEKIKKLKTPQSISPTKKTKSPVLPVQASMMPVLPSEQKPPVVLVEEKPTNSTVDEIVFKLIPRGKKVSRRWLRKAIELNPEQAQKDFLSGKLTGSNFSQWKSLHEALPQGKTEAVLLKELKDQWSTWRKANPGVLITQKPSNKQEKEGLDLHKKLSNDAKPLSEENRKKLSLPKVKPYASKASAKTQGKRAQKKVSNGDLTQDVSIIKTIFELLGSFVKALK